MPLRVLSADLGPLELRELIENAICELALRGLVTTVVQGADLRPVLLELAPEEVMIGGLAGEAVPVLGQHHRDTAGGHEVPHAVHAGPLKACAALSGVYYLLEDLVPFAGGVAL